MTAILNFISHIGDYAGPGMILFFIGIGLIIFASVRLSRLSAAERSRSVAEFNQQFVSDTRYGISDVESGARRAETAERLGIKRGGIYRP